MVSLGFSYWGGGVAGMPHSIRHGHHIYKALQTPTLGETLVRELEFGNIHVVAALWKSNRRKTPLVFPNLGYRKSPAIVAAVISIFTLLAQPSPYSKPA